MLREPPAAMLRLENVKASTAGSGLTLSSVVSAARTPRASLTPTPIEN